MATGSASATAGKEVDVRYTCCLCMEPYRGRSPKLLPCCHTFCLPCLTALEASVSSAKPDAAADDDVGQKEPPSQQQQAPTPKGDEGEAEAQPCEGPEGTTPALEGAPVESGDVTADQGEVDSGGSFLCPTCRAPVPVPPGGVAKLPTNFYVDHESDPIEDLPSVACDMCEEDNHATHACQQCHRNMCRTCRRCHEICTRDHHVTPISLGQPAKQKQEKKGVCLIHQDQVTCFYCCQCDVSICLHCKLTSHERHETADLVSAALQAREEILSLIPTAEQQLQVVEMAIQQVDRQDRQLTRHVQEVTQQIQARWDLLMTWATQSRDRLVEEVAAKEACTGSQLQGQKASSTLTRDTLSSLLSRAARATAADPDVLLWRKELKAALLSEHKLRLLQQRADSQGPSWHWGYDVTEASLLHEDDVRAYMGRVVEGADVEVKRVPVSLRDLTARVEGWMKEVTENTHTLTSQLASCLDDVTALQKKGEEQEKKTGELEKKTGELEKKTGELEKKTGELEKKTGELEKKTGELEKKTGELEKKTGEQVKKTGEQEKKTGQLEKKAGELEKKTGQLEKKTGELEKKAGELEKKAGEQEKKTGELEKKTGELEKKTGELEKKGEEQKKKGEEQKKKGEEQKKKGEEQEKKTTSLQKEATTSRKAEADLQKATQSLKENPGQGRKLFFVRGLNKTTTKQDQVMRFKRVEIDDGGHFSAETGRFTAPHAGIYFFTAGVKSNKTDTGVDASIMVDDVQHCVVHGSHHRGSGSVMVPLTAGQTVALQADSPVDQYDWHVGDGWYGGNSFSGTLVLPFP